MKRQIFVNLPVSGSREEVDELTRRAVAAGGRVFRGPQEHPGFMYAQSFQDLDGHIWELMHISGRSPV